MVNRDYCCIAERENIDSSTEKIRKSEARLKASARALLVWWNIWMLSRFDNIQVTKEMNKREEMAAEQLTITLGMYVWTCLNRKKKKKNPVYSCIAQVWDSGETFVCKDSDCIWLRKRRRSFQGNYSSQRRAGEAINTIGNLHVCMRRLVYWISNDWLSCKINAIKKELSQHPSWD